MPEQYVTEQDEEDHADTATVVFAECHNQTQNCQPDLQKHYDIPPRIALPVSIYPLIQPQPFDYFAINLGKVSIDKADTDIGYEFQKGCHDAPFPS